MAVYNIDSVDTELLVANDIINCDYSGAARDIILRPGTYKLECWGAQGGDYDTTYLGGRGGYSIGTIELSEETSLFIYTGGAGEITTTTAAKFTGGFNGGGDAYGSTTSTYRPTTAGGASDIRIGIDSLYARVIVAGGGGGISGRYRSSQVGAGGGVSGTDATDYSTSYYGGRGGTQTSEGTSYNGTTVRTDSGASFGQGGGVVSSNSHLVGPGGGGWYGGGIGVRSGGGGGSGYVYTSSTAENYPEGCLLNNSMYLSNAATIAGNAQFDAPDGTSETGHSGNGYIRITILDIEPLDYDIYDIDDFILDPPVSLNVKDKIKCNYNGSSRAIQLPAGCYEIQCYGAQGGDAKASGGKGGYATGIIKLDGTETLYVYVGGQGTSTVDASTNAAGGFNGGGDARTASTTYHCGSGGGASDIRINADSLYARVIVAGGGGGSGGYTTSMNGGAGGGIEGKWGKQYDTSYYHGKGGTQTAAGISYYSTTADSTTYYELANFGTGSSANSTSSTGYRAGGGGGWYGGGAANYSGAGGGSSYVWTPDLAANYPTGCLLTNDYYLANGHLESDKKIGDGYIELKYLGNINLINVDSIASVPIITSTTDFVYTGTAEIAQLVEGTYQLECWGAEGGYRSSNTYAGKGGYSTGVITIVEPTNIYLYVGGSGNSVSANSTIKPGGFNGGGYRYQYHGGGGGTDIRIGTDSLYARVIVAGGGGSDGATNKKGMYGGGEIGGSSTESYTALSNYCGKGGNTTYSGYSIDYTIETQTTTGLNSNTLENYGGGFGFGGGGVYLNSGYGGAGGGGWYGGSGTIPDGSGDDDRGGGGGSSYVYTEDTASNYPSGCLLNNTHYLSSALTIAGDTSFTSPTGVSETGHTGDGYIRITPITITGNTVPTIPSFKKRDIIYSYYNNQKRNVALPKGVYQFDIYGAQGGNGLYDYGGLGGYSTGILNITEDLSIYIYTGGQGIMAATTSVLINGGFNGGGDAYTSSSSYRGGSGGGASDVRIGQDSLYSRAIVAGGGGGAGAYNNTSYTYILDGGTGGGISGTSGGEFSTSYKAGTGGTQTEAGISYYTTTIDSTSSCTPASFGTGGSAKANNYQAGGGGGWYGGGCSSYYSAGGGGSGYIYTEDTASNYPEGCLLDSSYYLTNAATTNAKREGSGYVQITVLDTNSINGKVKVSSIWKEIDSIYIKVGGQWKTVDSLKVKTGGSWRDSS